MKLRCPTSCADALITELLDNRQWLFFATFVPPLQWAKSWKMSTTLGGGGEASGGNKSLKALQALPEFLNSLRIPRGEVVLAEPMDKHLNLKAIELMRKKQTYDLG